MNTQTWHWNGNNDSGKNKSDEFLIYNEQNNCIAKIAHTNSGSKPSLFCETEQQAEANTKLIAHAPELLSLLQWIVNEVETTPDELSDALLGLIKIRCNQSIQKATS